MDEPALSQPPSLFRRIPTWAWIVAIVAAAAIWQGWIHLGGSHVSQANPDQLATTIGAAWCQDSGYYLTNRLDGSKAELYDCNMRNGSYRCVTDQNGLAADVTAEARLVFRSTLGSEKPSCVTVHQ